LVSVSRRFENRVTFVLPMNLKTTWSFKTPENVHLKTRLRTPESLMAPLWEPQIYVVSCSEYILSISHYDALMMAM
jgi:hypothetical protein